MPLFHPDRRHQNEASRRLWARYEIAYTAVDFGAAFAFVVGSVMFFFAAWQTAGTWFFLIGSILFAAKPTIRLVRELKLYEMGDEEDLAERYKG
ncbi:YrhK family protein [Pseudoroseicyclus sp. CXY001]|uniref:YrhK family protein n=1 Tax=Pseudoroseicyclus sp. CXY001 TaxID=3242492 RepID=UPI003570A8B4